MRSDQPLHLQDQAAETRGQAPALTQPSPLPSSSRLPLRKMTALALLGFASGLPNILTGRTLNTWLTTAGIKVEDIGLFAFVTLPYSLKFLWAPLMDRFELRFLGRRRGWLIITQLLLIASLMGLSVVGESVSLGWIAGLAMVVTFLSASQDIVADAYRTDVLNEADRGRGAAVWITGYRVAMIAGMAGVMALVGRMGMTWPQAYQLAAAMLLVGVVGCLLAPADTVPAVHFPTLEQTVVEPFQEVLIRRGGLILLLFVVLFKLPDVLSSQMSQPFLIKIGFKLDDIDWVTGFLGIAITIVGVWLGGWAVDKFGLWRMMWLFAILHSVSNFGFWVLSQTGAVFGVMVVVIVVENLCVGLATAGFFAFLMSRCDARYSAAQFALFTSLMALTGVLGGAISGYLVVWLAPTEHLELASEWGNFFLLTVLAGGPALVLLPWLKEKKTETTVFTAVAKSNLANDGQET